MKEALCFVTMLSSLSAIFGFIEAENGGVSMDLVRRQLPHSPYYNTSSDVESPLKPDEVRASYLMTLKIGTAPVEISASADSGSSLIWTQCSSTKQHKTPPFDPTKSSTYKVEAFGSEACGEAPGNSRGSKNECNYTQQYGKGSASGVLATDTFVFDSTDGKAPVPFVKSVFGCTLDDEAQLGSDEGGVAGLGPGPLSLVSQFSKVKIKRIFSYCFSPPDADRVTKLRFGTTAKISGNGIVSTPIENDPLHYRITLEAITIGGKYKVPLTPLRKGNMVIDSGTTLTYLKPKFYAQVVKAVQNVVQETLGLEPVPDEKYLCYSTHRLSEFPDMIFHFAGEADLTLKPLNTFFPNGPTKYCMAISPPPGRATPPTFGNWAQVNLQVEYDLENMKLSFAPFSTRCYSD